MTVLRMDGQQQDSCCQLGRWTIAELNVAERVVRSVMRKI